MDGIGFRRAFVCGIRGTPCITRGSFMSVGSNLAGTVGGQVSNLLEPINCLYILLVTT